MGNGITQDEKDEIKLQRLYTAIDGSEPSTEQALLDAAQGTILEPAVEPFVADDGIDTVKDIVELVNAHRFAVTGDTKFLPSVNI